MFFGVVTILGNSPPRQIFWSVVSPHSIKMAAYLSHRTRPRERFKNKRVNGLSYSPLSGTIQPNEKVMVSVCVWFKNPARFMLIVVSKEECAHSSEAADFVQSIVSRNCFPEFCFHRCGFESIDHPL